MVAIAVDRLQQSKSIFRICAKRSKVMKRNGVKEADYHPRIVQLVSGMMYGGGQRVAEQIACCPEDTGTATDTVLWLLGTRYQDRFRSPVTCSFDYSGDYRNLFTMLKLGRTVGKRLHDSGAELVHTHGWDADLVGSIATRGSLLHHISHQHLTAEWMTSRRIRHRVRRWLTGRILGARNSTVIAVSEAVARHISDVVGYPRDSISVIHNGIDTSKFSAKGRNYDLADATMVVGVAARLAPMKGLEVLIRAVAAVQKECPCRLLIAGTGESEKALRRCADELAAPVRFLGHVNEIEDFYSSVDVFALPSISNEGLPLAVLEAMSSGLPVLGTNVGGTRELVMDRVTGFIGDPGDTEFLADRLKALYASRDLRQKLGTAARRRVEREFSMDRFCTRIREKYDQLIGRARA